MTLVYKYSQLNNRASYDYAIKKTKEHKQLHLGQFKLLFTELLFLTKYAHAGNIVLYVGAAPGHHTTLLADLFPNLQFDLWDPRKFETEPRKNIKTYQEKFTIDQAKRYAELNEKILFICDIRTLSIGKYKREKNIKKMDEVVEDDMEMQAQWAKIIKPVKSYLKFRLPYLPGKTSYFSGTIYLQPYSRISTETRVLTDNYDEMIKYDNTEFEEKMAYFNAEIRYNSNITYHYWNNLLIKLNMRNIWDNVIALHILHYYLSTVNHTDPTEEEVGKLFMNFVEFHKKKYGEKYDALFN